MSELIISIFQCNSEYIGFELDSIEDLNIKTKIDLDDATNQIQKVMMILIG